MRRSDREIQSADEIKNILDKAMVLRLGLFDGEYPYVVPLHYGYEMEEDGRFVFYMHCAKEGHKLDLIRMNPNVCAEMEGGMELVSGGEIPCRYGARFSSVIVRGKAGIVENASEKIHALSVLMRHQTGQEFVFNEEMVESVSVIKVTSENITAKARVK